jgi:aerobic carbon-monoxide dehydrogenase large subunit
MVVVRSPIAHATLAAIDQTAARRLPGVVDVLTAADLPEGMGQREVLWSEGATVAHASIPMLAARKVRFAGEPVAAILADSRALAEDAAELLEVDYDPLPVVVEPEDALGADAILHDAAPDNVLVRWSRESGDVDAVFEGADLVVRGSFRLPRLVAAPIEPRGCLAAFDADRDLLTMWLSSQDPHRPRSNLSEMLGRPAASIRVVIGDVGGAFGSKGAAAPEHGLAAVLAMRSGRPVKWVEDRRENFLAAYQGRGVDVEAELAVARDGRFLGLRARLTADLGAYLYPATPTVPVNSAMLCTGAYDIPAAAVELVGVATNKPPTGPYRGAGRPEAAFVAERMADLAAIELGLDPVEIRRRNAIPSDRFPYRTPLGFTYDSGNYVRVLDRAVELIGYRRWREQQGAAGDRGRMIGIGISLFVERAGSAQWESAAAAVEPDGRVVVWTGSTAHGQGHPTTFSQIAADVLGVDPSCIEVRAGDSDEVPPGVGTFGSRSVTIGGSAIVVVLEEIKARAIRLASTLLETSEEDLRWDGGQVTVAGSPDRGVSLWEIAEAARERAAATTGPAESDVLAASGRFTISEPVFPFGAHGAVVGIDPETGEVNVLRLVAVDDAGTIVNPELAAGQVVGSSVQGLAEALWEEAVYDDEGQLMTGSFASYGIPAASEVAAGIESELLETPSPLNPLGAKGIGESGCIGMPAAIASAVADALSRLGIRHLDPPYTHPRVWRAIRESR